MANKQENQQQLYLKALHETALALMNRLELNDLLQTIVGRACEILQTAHGFIYLLEPETNVMVVKVGLGVYQSYLGALRHREEASASSEVWRSGRMLTITDYHHWAGRAVDRNLHPPQHTIHSMICLPLKSGAEVVGLIGVAFREVKAAFSPDEVYVMERLADLASIALDNAKLYQALQTELEERKRAEEALRASEINYRGIFDSVSDLIFVIDPQSARIVDCNERVSELSGAIDDKRQLLAELSATLLPTIQQLLAGASEQRWTVQWLPSQRREPIWLEFSVRQAVLGTTARVLAVARDVTERKVFEENLKRQAYHDALTDLPNRRLLEKHLDRLIDRAAEESSALTAVIFIDLDGFKQVNDWLGHEAGDAVLRRVAMEMKSYVGEQGLVARMGGDEFVAVVDDVHARGGLKVALQALKNACYCKMERSGRTVTVTGSMGVSLFPGDGSSAAALIRNADKAMYLCKETQRDGYRLASDHKK